MSTVAWSREALGEAFPEPWRFWRAGGMRALPPGAPAPAGTGPGEGSALEAIPSGAAPDPPRLAGPQEQGGEGGRGPVLWHQVQPHEDWATLVARYNIAEPRELLAANGLAEPKPLVPGDWVCVPCHLARPVWELLSDQAEEEPHA